MHFSEDRQRNANDPPVSHSATTRELPLRAPEVACIPAKLGPDEILAPPGERQDGEVWKARDTRLGRDVALQVSAKCSTESGLSIF